MGPKCAFLLVHCLLLLLLQGTVQAEILENVHVESQEEASSPEEVVRLLKGHSVTRFRLFDSNPPILRALANSSINVIVGVPNTEVKHLAVDSKSALEWVRTNISPYMRDTDISIISVGEDEPSQTTPISMFVNLAVRNLRDALVEENFNSRVDVATPSTMSALSDKRPAARLQSSKIGHNQTYVVDFSEIFTSHRRLGDGRGFVWCVVRLDSNVYDVQSALNWACARINCAPTYAGGRCFIPNTIWDHASWAFNAYFNSMNGAPESCNFSGTAYISSNDPSSQQCFYQGTNRALVVNAANIQVWTGVLPLIASVITSLLVLLVL